MIGGDIERFVVDGFHHRVVIVEHDGGAGVAGQSRLCRRGFHDGAARGEIAFENGDAAARRNRLVERADDVVIPDFGVRIARLDRLASDGELGFVQEGQELFEEGGEAACVEEILHQERARGPEIGNDANFG